MNFTNIYIDEYKEDDRNRDFDWFYVINKMNNNKNTKELDRIREEMNKLKVRRIKLLTGDRHDYAKYLAKRLTERIDEMQETYNQLLN